MLAEVSLKSLVVWAGILVLTMLNGALREAVLIPKLGTATGLVLSGLLLSALIIAVSYAALPWLDTRQLVQLLAVGLGWFALTLVFEFSFGLWQGTSWPALLEAYTFKDGNIWSLVLLITAFAPYIAAELRGWA